MMWKQTLIKAVVYIAFVLWLRPFCWVQCLPSRQALPHAVYDASLYQPTPLAGVLTLPAFHCTCIY
jgi:hypothetical protein